ncbi:MAG: cytochrome c biogenesis protein CcdA, partial [Acidimicrobiia bacterium]
MGGAPLALAFAAGMLATVNPCGFAMLPAYLSYFVGLEDDPSAAGADRTVLRSVAV